jgi:hypothetical protein
MKYIFVAGAPGSKWSSVVKNIYYSNSIDRSDYSDERTYYHDASGKLDLMHLGAYFDPGMEFELPEYLTYYPKEDAEKIFNKPFSGKGVRIIKSHIFSYKENIDYLRKNWPECPIVLVYRNNDSCLGWWVRCGHFDITYPSYVSYYKNLRQMSKLINDQNDGILNVWNKYPGIYPRTNVELADNLNIEIPDEKYYQHYASADIKVAII